MKQLGLVLGLALCAAGAALFASSMWNWVLEFDPGFTFTHPPVPTGPALSGGVTILLVDGLRLDASRRMDTLNALRARGADLEGQVGTPSFSRPGRATVAVGAPPDIHGVTTNRQRRAIPLDNILRRVGESGGTCRVAGSTIWSGLFGDDIRRCGVYREGEGKEGPGAFVRQVAEVRASQEAGIAFVLEKPATLRIADVISTDFAAHEYGGVSSEYAAEVRRTDALLADLVSRLDLTSETLIVTADHGHRDEGGHGGDEAPVLAIPIVMAGAGIVPGVRATGSQADIAPTVAVLLGTALPTASSGRPLVSVLALDEGRRDFLKNAIESQREGFERAIGDRLGYKMDWKGNTDFASLAFRQRDEEKNRMVPILILVLTGVPAIVLAAIHFSRASRAGLWAGLFAGILSVAGPVGSRIPPMSFSAINYDQMLLAFFQQVMMLAAAVTLAAGLAAALVGHLAGRNDPRRSAVDTVGAMGLLLSAILVITTATWWWNHDLLALRTLPGPTAMVQAFSLALSAVSASLTTLLLMVAARVIEAAPRGEATPAS